MRFAANGWVVLAAALVLAGCDSGSPVDNPATPDQTTAAASPSAQESDALITGRIQAKFFADDSVKGHQIDVDTADGVVTLKGAVDNDAARKTAEQIARSVEGVTRVDNQLAVRQAGNDQMVGSHHAPAASPVDTGARTPAWITSKVQSQFYLNPELKPWKIDVDTSSSGVVTLRGAVDSEDDRAEALRIARSTEGVTRVNDNLRVEPQATATTGTAADTAPGGASRVREEGREAREDVRAGARKAGDTIEDAWITMTIQSKYFIHDEIKSRQVDVDTKDGVVTLTGSVPSAAAKQAAEVIAQDTDGVTKVINALTVTGQ